MEEKDKEIVAKPLKTEFERVIATQKKKAITNHLGCFISNNKGNKSTKADDKGWVKVRVEGAGKYSNGKNKQLYLHNIVLFEDPKYELLGEQVEGTISLVLILIFLDDPDDLYEASHLCHNRKCFNKEHLVIEPGKINRSRWCRALVKCPDCELEFNPCPHNPKCIL